MVVLLSTVTLGSASVHNTDVLTSSLWYFLSKHCHVFFDDPSCLFSLLIYFGGDVTCHVEDSFRGVRIFLCSEMTMLSSNCQICLWPFITKHNVTQWVIMPSNTWCVHYGLLFQHWLISSQINYSALTGSIVAFISVYSTAVPDPSNSQKNTIHRQRTKWLAWQILNVTKACCY